MFQVEKQFDALLVDTSAPVFDTTSSDTTNVSRDEYTWSGNDHVIITSKSGCEKQESLLSGINYALRTYHFLVKDCITDY